MMCKQEETVEIWEKCNNDISKVNGFDYDKLVPYLEVFDDVPLQHKKDTIYKFTLLLNFYIIDNNSNGLPMHNKAMTEYLYKKIQNDIKKSQNFLNILEDYDEEIITYDIKQKIENFINKLNDLINTKAVTKTRIKGFLLKINQEFNLRKSFQVKQLVDRI